MQIIAEEGLNIWHLIDPRFPLPKAQITCQFMSPTPMSSCESAALHDVFVKCLADHTTETIYMASMAELNCDIIGTTHALILKVYGFSEKSFRLLDQVLSLLFQPDLYLTSAIVERQGEVLKRLYNNSCMKVIVP